MFGPWLYAIDWFRRHAPRWLRTKRRMSFITLHYVYVISLILISSVILFACGDMAYIDALFFASGAVTQSGLNTLNVNDIHLSQQIILYVVCMMATPIYINSFVVFVRLYWFERRFQNIVQNSIVWRRTRSRARTETMGLGDSAGDAEKGVGGRRITVLRNTGKGFSGSAIDEKEKAPDARESTSAQSSKGASTLSGMPVATQPNIINLHRGITFADEIKAQFQHGNEPETDSDDEPLRLPQRISTDQHIAFLEAQRNPKDKVLRIPSPREFDRGGIPTSVEDDEPDLARRLSLPPSRHDRDERNLDSNENDRKRSITIDEPNFPRQRTKSTSQDPRLQRSATEISQMSDPARMQRLHAYTRRFSRTFSGIRRSMSQEQDPAPYLSFQPTIGRNSAFVDLTEDQREELGGIEYRSLKTLALILVGYYVGFHIFAVVILLPWILHTEPWASIVEADGVTKPWWGFFTAASAFNDLGFTLTPDSMISFQKAALPLILMSFLIVIGNTGFPCMLRLIIWVASKLAPINTGIWEELRFLLDHPRRCFTLLFPKGPTWWLFWILVIMNGVDLIFFFVLDISDSTVTAIPGVYRFLNGLFQAFSTRTAGFSSVNLAELHPAIQVSYLVMMYISVYPIAVSIRQTNVYEEKSLGVYQYPDEVEDNSNENHRKNYLGAHLRRQLGFDLWFVFLGLFIITIVEGSQLETQDDSAFSIFAILFEIVSAYGTVGLSLGYPNTDMSFSAQFHTLSKLVIIAMQIRGRHRGLPYDLDRAILLPSDSTQKTDDPDVGKKRRRSSAARSDRKRSEDRDRAGPDWRSEAATSTGVQPNL